MRANPQIRIDPFVRLRMEGPRGEATLYMAIAGQTAPDVLYVNARSMQKYIEQGFLDPLDDLIGDDMRREALFQKLRPTLSRDGHAYAVPARVAVHALLYRKDLFAAAGLDPERPPTNWDELLSMSRRLTIREKGQYGIVLPGGSEAGWRFADFVWQAGGELVRRTPDGWRLTLDEPPAIAALEYYKELRWGKWKRDGREMQGAMRVDATGQSVQHVLEGRAAMTIVSTTGDVGRFISDPAIVGIAPLPAGPAGEATMLEGEFWGINAAIAHDAQRRRAAWAYIRFVTSDEAKRIQTRTYVESGAAGGVPPDWLEKYGYHSELQAMPRSWVAFSKNLLEHGRLEPYAPGYDQVATEGLSHLDEVLYDEHADPAAVLANINAWGNKTFFITTPPQVMGRRRSIARGVAAALALGVTCILAWWVRRRMRQHRETPDPVLQGRAGMERRHLFRLGLLFLLPAVLTIFIWDYYPLVRGAMLAFTDYHVSGESRMIGLDNFINVFLAGTFWESLVQTLVYVVMSLGIGFVLPILLAVLLSEIGWGKIFFRTLFYLPAVTSGVVVLTIWKMMYDGAPTGVFNQALAWMGGTVAGRLLTVGIFALFWWLVTALAVRATLDTLAFHLGGSRIRLRLPRPAAAAGAGLVLPPVVLGAWHLPTTLLPAIDARPPVAFLIYGALFMALVLLASAMILLSSAARDNPTARKKLCHRLTAGVGVVAALLAIQLYGILGPTDRPYPWLQDPTGYWAMLWVIVPGLWAGVGPGCIIYLAAIVSIPDELYEAADLDGAGPLQKLYHVTIQSLLPLIVINFVGAVVGTFHAMESVLVLTGGGPGNATMTLGMDIFFNAFTHLRFGYATAEAWVMGSLLIGFTVYQLRSLKRMEFKRAG